ncbi:MAG: rane fusion protein multidrug efflux system [Variibacter sp.]|jgi:multidrug efflux system membrane fusion protein|nr:rane fusion protein multidrug efflux system [Variibacter sp.]
MRKLRRFLAFITFAVIITTAAVIYLNQAPQRQRTDLRGRGDAPVPVLAATARSADVPVYLEGVGTTRALNTVTVRPQVEGKLISVGFKEGQDVRRGDVLAKIDPATYKAQLDQATAKKAQDEATLANARMDLERYTRLAASNAGPKQQADTQRATVAQLEAQVKSDQAAIDNAQTYLNWTTITAPIDGRTGLRLVDEGNIVRAGDILGIVVITQIKPISVLFNLPQQQLPQVNRALARGALQVETVGLDNKTVLDRGTLQVVDNQVDPATGTVRLKAEFPNPELQLWPGQFVNVRLLIETLPQVIVVPTAAVQRGPSGAFVYVVQPDNTAAVRNVNVTQQDETQAVIGSGLQAGERVVTSGFARLTNNARVSVTEAPDQTDPALRPAAPITPAPPEVRRRPDRGGGERPESSGRGEGRRGQRSEAAPGPPP